jgi:hypothetical protein
LIFYALNNFKDVLPSVRNIAVYSKFYGNFQQSGKHTELSSSRKLTPIVLLAVHYYVNILTEAWIASEFSVAVIQKPLLRRHFQE